MSDVEGARTFLTSGSAYDGFMGRYSKALAGPFADAAGVQPGHSALDVGCGPGALTGELVARLGVTKVAACDPSPDFVAACRDRHPGVRVEAGRAEALPFDAAAFDHALAQLVLHFVTEPEAAAREMARVVRPGGTVAACVWDFADGMEMLRLFWDAALAVDPSAPDEARTMRFGRPGEIAELFTAAGLADVAETTLEVASSYATFDELWAGFLAGIGPAGSWCASRTPEQRDQLRSELAARMGHPTGAFTLRAVARGATARVPA